MATLTVDNKRPRRDRLGEPFVVRGAFRWSGHEYNPGDQIPPDMLNSPTVRLHWWLRRKIVPVADVTGGLPEKPKRRRRKPHSE